MPTENSVISLTLTPMTRAEASDLVKRLLGSYPVLNAHDPETYIANLVALFIGYPLWAGEQALGPIKVAAPEWPPAEGKARKILEDQVRAHRFAEEWGRGARQTKADRLLEGPSAAPRETYEQLKARHGENWGLSPADRDSKRYRWMTLEEMKGKFGAEKVDAVPNAEEWKKLKSDFAL